MWRGPAVFIVSSFGGCRCCRPDLGTTLGGLLFALLDEMPDIFYSLCVRRPATFDALQLAMTCPKLCDALLGEQACLGGAETCGDAERSAPHLHRRANRAAACCTPRTTPASASSIVHGLLSLRSSASCRCLPSERRRDYSMDPVPRAVRREGGRGGRGSTWLELAEVKAADPSMSSFVLDFCWRAETLQASSSPAGRSRAPPIDASPSARSTTRRRRSGTRSVSPHV